MQENLACAPVPLINAYVVKSSRDKGIIFVSLYLHPFLCMRAVKALVSLSICTDSPGPSLLDEAICTKILCAGPTAFSLEISIIAIMFLYEH